jgi:hypothetical protein
VTKTWRAIDYAILADHVGGPVPKTGPISTFKLALIEARTLTGRDLTTGAATNGGTSTLWAGTAVYFILLEQIGRSLRPKTGRALTNKRKEYEIEQAVRQFLPRKTSERQRNAVYALRCAFAHRYALINLNYKPEYQHVFRLTDDAAEPLIGWPRTPWNGKIRDAKAATSTTVNLIKIGDLCEDVVRSARQHAIRGTLRSLLSAEELQRTYSIVQE